MEKPHTSTEKQSLMTQVMEIIESMSNQRIFLIDKPMTTLFNHLICGYTDENYSELLKKKINNEKND